MEISGIDRNSENYALDLERFIERILTENLELKEKNSSLHVSREDRRRGLTILDMVMARSCFDSSSSREASLTIPRRGMNGPWIRLLLGSVILIFPFSLFPT